MADAKPSINTSDPLLLRLAQAASGGGVRAPLAVWMDENHDAAAQVIGSGANWQRLSKVWMDAGLIIKPEGYDEPGKTGAEIRKRVAETAKRTWFRIHSRRKASKDVDPTTPGSVPALGAASAEAGTPQAEQAGDENEPVRKFGMAKSRG